MKIMAKIAVLFTACVFLSSCIPDSEKPLSDPVLSTIDKRLIGVWYFVNDDGEATYTHFAAKDSHWMQALTVDHLREGGLRAGKDALYEFFISEIGKDRYMNFIVLPEEKSKEPPAYFFGKYEISDDGSLLIWLLDNEDTVRAAIEAGRLKGVVSGKKDWTQSVRIKDSAEKITAFITAADPKTLFSEKPMKLKKIHEPLDYANS